MELLSPAGTKEKLEVAFHYGADAVYLGGVAFNLRNQSNNFTIDELKTSIERAEKLNKKIYFTLNAFLHEYDMGAIREYIEELKTLNINGFIVADMGVFSLLKKIIPSAEIHISTQANTTNSETCNLWASLGATRIVLARELSIDEIKRIRDNTDIELECFIHGAVCMSYSGRCSLSSHMTGRDANKGDCAQACRWNYKLYLEEKTRPGEFLEVNEDGDYSTILSAYDLNMSRHLHLLKSAGVSSLKIEGRMKSAYYVANTVRIYRKLLDCLEAVGIENYEKEICNPPYSDYIKEFDTISRRESNTGFYLSAKNKNPDINPTLKGYQNGRRLMAMVIDKYDDHAIVRVYNTIHSGDNIVVIGRDFVNYKTSNFELSLKLENNDIVPVEQIRNVDSEHAIIKIKDFNLSLYDIITIEE